MKLISYINILIFSLIFSTQLIAQVSKMRCDLCPPLKIPLSCSGSFGELRRTHFHSGVDFRTNGKCGYRVYASEKGFVARIVVSPVGYGRAVYVQHPNGLMTVYAHLRNFAPQIEKYVREQQYENESWALDVSVKQGRLPVSRGMIVGYSGNAGSSGGPHLHYEVRDMLTQEPINPFFYFKPKDNIRPKIQQLYLYDIDGGKDVFSCPVDKFRVEYVNKKFVVKNVREIKCSGLLGFGIKVKDFVNGSWSTLGVYSIRMFVNGELKYRYEADRFSFSNTGFVNVVKDYKFDVEKNVKVYKTWMPESCCFECVKDCVDNGIVKVEKDSVYNVGIEVRDLAGNESLLKFKVKGNGKDKKFKKEYGRKFLAGKSYEFGLGDLDISLGKNALFDDVCFDSCVDTLLNKGYYKNLVYCIGGDCLPLKSRIKLAIKLDEDIVSKAYFVNVLNSGRCSSVGGWVENDTLFCKVKNLGSYSVCFDTISPKIVPLGKYSLKRFGGNRRMFFRIDEKESGICKYEGRLDGVWVLTSYDAKRNKLECFFDKTRVKTGSKHKFVLTVSDNCGNVSKYETVIYL
jgi:hypothetical protein